MSHGLAHRAGEPNQAQAELEWLRDLVRQAAARLERAAQGRELLEVERKGQVDLVTSVDRDLQAFVVDAIGRRHSGDVVVAEESPSDAKGAEPVSSARVWYVDPVDGTTNFVHGYPFYAISIGLWEDARAGLAAVCAPALDKLYSARRGGGAYEQTLRPEDPPRALRASGCRSLDEALLATGFPYQRGALARLNLACVAHALSRAHGIRRGGSAALDLCAVASGCLDGYWEMGLAPWDVAAGALIATEAGAIVSDFVGGEDHLEGGRICAAAPGLHPALLDMLAQAHALPEPDPLSASLMAPIPLSGALAPPKERSP